MNLEEVFNNVTIKVETLVGLGKLDERIAQSILESVINGLDGLGWEDQEATIKEYENTPFIVQAFENCGHKLLLG